MANDYFSSQSSAYRKFRPSYPRELFDFLASCLPQQALIWDCACGNGQATEAWSGDGISVIGSDLSRAQLACTDPNSAHLYLQALAEAVPLADRSVDLVTVAQALHWFDFERFYSEVHRVLKPGGLFAAWTYSFLTVTPQLGSALDREVQHFYHQVVGPYWPPERRWVDQEYASIPFPFSLVEAPTFSLKLNWNLAQVIGYLSSWSAVALYREANKHDPMPEVKRRLQALWGEPQRSRQLNWRLSLRLGRAD